MKSRRILKKRCLGNQGFTLVELLISIAILVLIMVPLMNNFYHSMLMNKKSEQIQQQSNLASNIMEGIKNQSVEDTLKQFARKVPFDIIPDASDFLILNYDQATGKYSKVNILPDDYKTLLGQSIYYFAIHGILSGDGSAYDALIKMNATTYKNVDNIMNNYPIPEAINLDQASNGLLFFKVDSIDENVVLETFRQWGEDYAKGLFYDSDEYKNSYAEYLSHYDEWKNSYETAKMEGVPESELPSPPNEDDITFNPNEYPDYCNEAIIKSRITKTMKITVEQNTKNTIQYQIIYSCSWPEGSTVKNNITYTIPGNSYSKILDNVYLFYEPSLFMNTNHPDVLELYNTTTEHEFNFYLAKQTNEGETLQPKVKIIKSSSETDKISLFTNLQDTQVDLIIDGIENVTGGLNTDIVKSEPKDRLYDVDIKIYDYVASDNLTDKYKKELYSINSSTEDR